ncbi:MAG TPA: response regulator, partial [Planctomycetota bacterium]|nr:response regulator [Planctomycetota bacterium]
MPITRLSSPAPKVPGDPKKPLVLCVDDDGAVLASLRRLFRGEPYDVITTASAAQALACLRRHPVSVIISDERMPGTSGSELLAEVRERWPWIGRIILTSFPGHEVMIRGLQAGVDFLLYKPWDEESLKRTIERLIQEVERTRSLLDAGSAKGADRAAEGEEASSTQPLRERHVVVAVDDDPQVLLALRRALRREPYQVLTTNLPEEAIRWIE